jgi:hypothetical protein
MSEKAELEVGAAEYIVEKATTASENWWVTFREGVVATHERVVAHVWLKKDADQIAKALNEAAGL